MGRLNYSVIFNRYKKLGKGNVRLTQSALFLTKPIQSTQSAYTFDVLETQTGTLQPDEIRLNLNDEFIIASMGLYLVGTHKSSEGAAFAPSITLYCRTRKTQTGAQHHVTPENGGYPYGR